MKTRIPDLDDLLSGGHRSEHETLAAVLRAAAEALPGAPRPEVAEQHLAAIIDEAAAHAHTAPSPAPLGRVAVWRRRAAHVMGATAVKVGVGVGVAAAATGGLAVTGSLPPPAQTVVSEVADRIGIVLPHPDDHANAGDTPAPVAPTAPADRPAGGDERGGDVGTGATPTPAEVPGAGRATAEDRPAETDAPVRPPAAGTASETPGQPAPDRDDEGASRVPSPAEEPASERPEPEPEPDADGRDGQPTERPAEDGTGDSRDEVLDGFPRVEAQALDSGAQDR